MSRLQWRNICYNSVKFFLSYLLVSGNVTTEVSTWRRISVTSSAWVRNLVSQPEEQKIDWGCMRTGRRKSRECGGVEKITTRRQTWLKYNYNISRHYPSSCPLLNHDVSELDSASVFRWIYSVGPKSVVVGVGRQRLALSTKLDLVGFALRRRQIRFSETSCFK
jgi:hypothetical protein